YPADSSGLAGHLRSSADSAVEHGPASGRYQSMSVCGGRQALPSSSQSAAPAVTSTTRNVDYWTDSRRPLASLVFVAPLLVLYEPGIMLLDAPQVAAVRNGADTWMRGGLLQVGLDRPWVLPVLIVTVLIGWQVIARFPWRTSIETLIGMGAESLLGAILLLVRSEEHT